MKHQVPELPAWKSVLTQPTAAGARLPGELRDLDAEWRDDWSGRPVQDAWYYVRAGQADGQCVWLIPWWFDPVFP